MPDRIKQSQQDKETKQNIKAAPQRATAIPHKRRTAFQNDKYKTDKANVTMEVYSYLLFVAVEHTESLMTLAVDNIFCSILV